MAKISKSSKESKPAKVEIVIMKSKIYNLVKGELKMRISASCFEIISQNVVLLVKKAAEQAKIDKRETIKPRHFDAVLRAAATE